MLSERRACGLVSIGRSTARYAARRRDDAPIRARLCVLAGEKPRYGYRRLHVLLRREGVLVNHKCVERIYREEGLSVRKRSGSESPPACGSQRCVDPFDAQIATRDTAAGSHVERWPPR